MLLIEYAAGDIWEVEINLIWKNIEIFAAFRMPHFIEPIDPISKHKSYANKKILFV